MLSLGKNHGLQHQIQIKEAEILAAANSGKNKGAENLRPFKKGQSGNPKGRPKIPDDIREMLKGATPSACKLLCDTINDENAKIDLRIKCSEIVLDRVFGKPQQAVEVDAKNIPQVIFVGGDKIAD